MDSEWSGNQCLNSTSTLQRADFENSPACLRSGFSSPDEVRDFAAADGRSVLAASIALECDIHVR
jgi:hypothetical protein